MRKLLATASAMMILSSCSITGIRDVPLPGGADVGEHPYTVKVNFDHVLDLVPQAAVRVNDVAVGRVASVTLPDNAWDAQVTLLVNGDVRLPANSYAYLEQSSLLGEKFVQLAAPKSNPQGSLRSGAIIPASRTNRYPEVEEVFGALSLLLNGGGLPQLRTISRELNNALDGNEDEIKSVLRRLTKLSKSLDSHKGDIVTALEKVNRLAATINARQKKVTTVLDDLEPGLEVLKKQRGAFVTMLKKLDKLSGTATNVIKKSKEDTVANLKALAPTLRKLADSGRNLPKSLELLLTYPFTDEVMNGAIKGDYLNVYLNVAAAPGHDCIIPEVDIDEPPAQPSGPNLLAATPKGPQPVPCGTPEPSTPPDSNPLPTTTPTAAPPPPKD